MNYDFNIEKIVLACYVRAGMGERVHKNRPSHGLAFHTGGSKEYVFDNGKRLLVNKNEIIYMPKYSSYVVNSLTSGDCYAINFDVSENLEFDPFIIKTKNSNLILEHFKQARNTWETKKSGYKMKCKAELYNILFIMQQEQFLHYISKNKLEIIRPAVEYIHESYSKELLSIAELSKMCGISPEYFRSIFKNYFGVSPVHYINSLKITRAKELLESEMYSVNEAAIQSGYTDMSHFSREFKKAVGICPSQYRLDLYKK